MVIEKEHKDKNKIRFSQIFQGDTFYIYDDKDKIFMKMAQDQWAKFKFGCNEVWANAVLLNCGLTYFICPDTEITPIKTKLIVEE